MAWSSQVRRFVDVRVVPPTAAAALVLASLWVAPSAPAVVAHSAPVSEVAASPSSVTPASAAAEARRVTLGLRRHTPPSGTGWGRVRPRVISNGGVPSGTATRLTWKRWGTAAARGVGKTAAYRPDSGYYGKLVRIVMRASRIRVCRGHRAYTLLEFRAQKRPNGPMPKRWSTWTSGMCQASPYG